MMQAFVAVHIAGCCGHAEEFPRPRTHTRCLPHTQRSQGHSGIDEGYCLHRNHQGRCDVERKSRFHQHLVRYCFRDVRMHTGLEFFCSYPISDLCSGMRDKHGVIQPLYSILTLWLFCRYLHVCQLPIK